MKLGSAEPRVRYPRCVSGRRACPPEDVGAGRVGGVPRGDGRSGDAMSCTVPLMSPNRRSRGLRDQPGRRSTPAAPAHGKPGSCTGHDLCADPVLCRRGYFGVGVFLRAGAFARRSASSSDTRSSVISSEHECYAGVGSEYAPDEVGVALHLSRGTACARIGPARRLLATLPDTFALWEAGRIDTSKARAIDEATVVLSDQHARTVEARVLPRAAGQTLAQLKAALARAVIAADPDGAEQRHRQARRDRRVVLTPEADGMASLWALLTATQAAGAYTWLTRLARGLGADDPRSMDTRRADLLAALLSGRRSSTPTPASPTRAATPPTRAATAQPAAPTPAPTAATARPRTAHRVRAGPSRPVTPGKPLIQVVIPYSTLTGTDHQPAELAGHGPIPASLAREVATDSIWHRLVTDPLSGTLLDHGRTTYHPPAALADHVKARDLYCRFPGCRRRAADAELDHITPWADGGTTSEPNLAATCTHHHRLKPHAPGWHVHTHPDGRLTWTTPTRHQHTTRPHDYRPDPAPALPEAPATKDPGPDPPPF